MHVLDAAAARAGVPQRPTAIGRIPADPANVFLILVVPGGPQGGFCLVPGTCDLFSGRLHGEQRKSRSADTSSRNWEEKVSLGGKNDKNSFVDRESGGRPR